MCDQQRLRPACAYTQSDQSICKSHEHSMTVKLLIERHLESLSLTVAQAAQAGLSLHLSKCHIVGNHMSRLIYIYVIQQCRPSCNAILFGIMLFGISSTLTLFVKIWFTGSESKKVPLFNDMCVILYL